MEFCWRAAVSPLAARAKYLLAAASMAEWVGASRSMSVWQVWLWAEATNANKAAEYTDATIRGWQRRGFGFCGSILSGNIMCKMIVRRRSYNGEARLSVYSWVEELGRKNGCWIRVRC